jgi:fatty acid desaturase
MDWKERAKRLRMIARALYASCIALYAVFLFSVAIGNGILGAIAYLLSFFSFLVCNDV